jgi:phosphatidylglycerophosphate synthase
MGGSRKRGPDAESKCLSFRERLCDLLTFSRVVIGLAILSLSFIGKDAYLAAVILVIIGGITDILDGWVARRYLGENKEGKLGKYDPQIDTLLVFCALAYFSLSGIVIPKVVGLGWIVLALIVIFAYKMKPKVVLSFEIPSILALIAIAGLYDLKIFAFVVLPVLCIGVIIEHKRIRYLLFDYFPKVFSK